MLTILFEHSQCQRELSGYLPPDVVASIQSHVNVEVSCGTAPTSVSKRCELIPAHSQVMSVAYVTLMQLAVDLMSFSQLEALAEKVGSRYRSKGCHQNLIVVVLDSLQILELADVLKTEWRTEAAVC